MHQGQPPPPQKRPQTGQGQVEKAAVGHQRPIGQDPVSLPRGQIYPHQRLLIKEEVVLGGGGLVDGQVVGSAAVHGAGDVRQWGAGGQGQRRGGGGDVQLEVGHGR